MSDNDSNTLQNIMEEGKKEFLEKGFKGASVRNIVKQAGVTTGAFYFYYPDKEALFCALVSPAVNGLTELLLSALGCFNELPKETQQETVFDYSTDKFEDFIAYIYDHFDTFKLLITCAEGSSFSDFIHRLVKIDVEYSLKFLENIGNDALASGRATPELLHIVSSAFYSGIFEIVVHDMTKEAADIHIAQLRRFFIGGWNTILNP